MEKQRDLNKCNRETHKNIMITNQSRNVSRMRETQKNAIEKKNIFREIKNNLKSDFIEGKKYIRENVVKNQVLGKKLALESKVHHIAQKSLLTSNCKEDTKVRLYPHTESKPIKQNIENNKDINILNNSKNFNKDIQAEQSKEFPIEGSNKQQQYKFYKPSIGLDNNSKVESKRKKMESKNSSLNYNNLTNSSSYNFHKKRISYAYQELSPSENKELDLLKKKENYLIEKINRTKQLRYDLLYNGDINLMDGSKRPMSKNNDNKIK